MRAVILKDKRFVAGLAWRLIRWKLHYTFRKSPLPLSCGFYITNKCNFRCSFCNIWRKPAKISMPLVKAKQIIDSLSGLGCFYFSVTGGEPLLIDYLFDVLSYARKNRLKYIHLVTNGYLLNSSNAIKLRDSGVNEVSISIDANELTHDKNRGMPGAYRNAIQAIENLKKYAPGINIVLNAIFSPQSPYECLHVVELANKLSVFAKVQPLNQHPMFNKDDCAKVSFQNISSLSLKEVITRLRKEKRIVNSNRFLENIYNFYFDKEKLIFKDSPCIFGYHHIEVLEDGSIYPCLEGMNWEGGMNQDKGLGELIRSEEYGKTLQDLRRCVGCQRSYYICYYEPRIALSPLSL